MATTTLRTAAAPCCRTPEDLSSIKDRYGFALAGEPEDAVGASAINALVRRWLEPAPWDDEPTDFMSVADLWECVTGRLRSRWLKDGVTIQRWPSFPGDMSRAAAWTVLPVLRDPAPYGLAVVAISRPATPHSGVWL